MNESIILQILLILTPKQRALFYLQVESQHKSIIKLKEAWETVRNIIYSSKTVIFNELQ